MTSPQTPRISVCMATYNGAEFIEEQLGSILDQLGPDDEVIVVDDASTDDTAQVVARWGDDRITLHRAPRNRGYVQTFGDALARAKGRYVFLADQDDVWTPGRLDAMCAALSTHAVVATNLSTLGSGDRLRGPFGQTDWRLLAADSRHHARNVLGILAGNRPYYGCAMGIRREGLAVALPFPEYLTESHDLWLALFGNLAGSIEHVEFRSLARRLHGGNQTPNRPRGIVPALRSRLLLLRCIATLRRRIASSRTDRTR